MHQLGIQYTPILGFWECIHPNSSEKTQLTLEEAPPNAGVPNVLVEVPKVEVLFPNSED